MSSFALISQYNGWNMAFAGMTIVFACLTLLAVAIAQIHRLLTAWDNRKKIGAAVRAFMTARIERKGDSPAPAISRAMKESARKFRMLSQFTGEPFNISDLVRFAEKRGLTSPCPRSAIEELLKARLIVKADETLFCWDRQVCETIL